MIEAYDSNNQLIDFIEEELQDVRQSAGPNGGFGEEICNWECVSSNYEYRIRAVDYNGFNFTQMNTLDFVDEEGIGIPHYRWFDPTEYALYTTGQGDNAYHGMPAGWIFPGVGQPYVPGAPIIKIENTPESFFCDINGTQITSQFVWGIQKTLGPWEDGNEYRMYDYGINLCSVQYGMEPPDGLEALINLMNNQNDNPNLATLACAANLSEGCSEFNDNDDGGVFDEDEIDEVVECNTVFTYTSQWGPIGDAIDVDFQCLPSSGSIINGEISIGSFLASSELFQIVELDESPETILLSSASDYVDPTGSPISLNLDLKPGLYQIIAKTPQKGVRYTIAEVKGDLNLSLLHKDYFDALVFPNPILGNSFNLQIQTSARLNVEYEILDSQGNLVWQQFFKFKKNHSASHAIQPNVQLPNGLIMHRFVFEDGSSETYTSLKN